MREFCISQVTVETFFRWGGTVQKTLNAEFLQYSVNQKLFKSVYFWRNYSKNKNVATFWDTVDEAYCYWRVDVRVYHAEVSCKKWLDQSRCHLACGLGLGPSNQGRINHGAKRAMAQGPPAQGGPPRDQEKK